MFPTTKTLFAVIACALLAHAQSNTTSSAPASATAGLDACILNCITQAAPVGNCSSYTDLPCVCTSSAFQQAALLCLQQNCTSSDLATATQLEQAQCAALSSGATSGATSTPATSATSATSSATSSSTSSSTSAAVALTAPISFGTIVGTLVASAGALVGAAFVL